VLLFVIVDDEITSDQMSGVCGTREITEKCEPDYKPEL
jgi:hypothetical protein